MQHTGDRSEVYLQLAAVHVRRDLIRLRQAYCHGMMTFGSFHLLWRVIGSDLSTRLQQPLLARVGWLQAREGDAAAIQTIHCTALALLHALQALTVAINSAGANVPFALRPV